MYVKQFLIIVVMYGLGYGVSEGFSLPVPANVMGLLFLLLALCLKLVKLPDVEATADFITSHLALIFLVPTVGIMKYFDVLSTSFFQIFVPLLVSILVGLVVAGWTTQFTIRLMAQHRQKKLCPRGAAGDGCISESGSIEGDGGIEEGGGTEE